MDFEKYLSDNAGSINDVIASFYIEQKSADIARYLYTPLAKYSANGGKRHRPLICILACRAVGGTTALALHAAAAIEHFHTAALIHDDIADESTMRHGAPCLHLTEGMGLAINAGDLALSQVTGTVLQDEALADDVKLRVLNELVNMTTRTIEGQALDIGWARDGRFDLTVDDYLLMATHKTAYYSGGVPLAVGAIIGGGNEREIETLRSFGMAAGLAFQIQDDLLNLVGDETKLGKDFRSDITEGKRTLPVVYTIQECGRSDIDSSKRLVQILSSHTSSVRELDEAVCIMREAGAIEYAHDYASKLVNDATEALIKELQPSNARDLLVSMGDFFIRRNA
ncbi:MAG: polyprenyl synthetase family protein [Coriobacteriales bacterium]|jgi:geranylgeranyl diphosphate synthase type I|nr:polyprenyl synthetase family protein [Coriobacteriales bacterium]